MRLLKDNCRSIRDLLPLHVGGDLEPGPARRVDEHLHHCLSCFREFRELTAMRQRLGVLAEQQPPAAGLDGFTEEVMARIALGERGPAAELPGVRRSRPAAMLPLAAAATLMLGVGLVLGYMAQTRGAAAPAALAPSAGTPSAGSSALSQVENLIPSEVHGSPVGSVVAPVRGPYRTPTWLNDLGVQRISPEQRALIDSAHLPAMQKLQLLMQGARPGGLTPEPDRQLRLRAPETQPAPVVTPAQDG